MQTRKQINDQLILWIRQRIETTYSDDISLALLYGSCINGTANEHSDVDCYFIPVTDRGYEMAADFILAGVGYDIFPMDWERVHGIAALKESLLPCVGDVQILYSRSVEDQDKFQELQRSMRQNLSDSAYMRQVICERWQNAARIFSDMKTRDSRTEIRTLAGELLMTLAEIVAFSHHDYFHRGLKMQYEDLLHKFSDRPEGFAAGYAAVIQTSDERECLARCGELISLTADQLHLEPPAIPVTSRVPANVSADTTVQASRVPDYVWLAGLYEELSSTFHKIYVCCETGNYILAYLSAVCLQRDLNDAVSRGGRSYDLLGAFHYRALDAFSAHTRRIEADYVSALATGGAALNRYDSFEAFTASMQ